MSKQWGGGEAPELRMQYVAADWISEVIFAPKGEKLDLHQPTIVGQIKIQQRWYSLFLQLAGPIPLIWIVSRLTGKPVWLTEKAKKKIDQLLASKEQQT